MMATAIWILCGIASCVIFICQEGNYLKKMDFFECIMFTGLMIGLCVIGPIGLIFFLLASLIHYISNNLL
jgi:hypothetical protein